MSGPNIPPEMPAANSAEWRRHRERGSRLLMRLMALLSLNLGRPTGRVLLRSIALYFFLFAPTARRNMLDYLRRALGREPSARERFRLVMNFASTVLDRLYLIAGRNELFELSIQGEPLIGEVVASGQGAFLLGAHYGSFEVLRSLGLKQPGLRVVMAMFEEHAARINSIFAAASPDDPPEIIALGQMQAMLQIRNRLDQGACVGMLADRTLGEDASLAVTFLGATVRLPTGPMRAAAAMRRRVIFLVGPYRGGNRYEVIFQPLADFSQTPAGQMRAAIEAAVTRYAALLEQCCRDDPYNWFNFFDFWRSSASADATPTES